MLCRSSATWSTSGCSQAGRRLADRRPAFGNSLVELALEVADLVAQLGGVLEPQLLGRGEHLLLELDDRLLDLGGLHPLDLPPAAPRARHLGLGLEELGDVGD